MREVLVYEVEGLRFEFVPESATKGALTAIASEAGGETFMLKVDLASLKGRQTFTKEALELFGEAFNETTLKRALNDFAVYLQEQAQIREAKAEETEETDDDDRRPDEGSERHGRAMALLRDPRLLARAAVDMKRLGHVGEGRNKQLAFVCAISARAGVPIQPSTHAQSSAGKNALWDMVLSLFPEEKIVRRSGMSTKALFRTSSDLRGAVLYIQEVAGSENADFSIRVLQSDGRLEYEATETMPNGSMQTVVHTTEGPTV